VNSSKKRYTFRSAITILRRILGKLKRTRKFWFQNIAERADGPVFFGLEKRKGRRIKKKTKEIKEFLISNSIYTNELNLEEEKDE